MVRLCKGSRIMPGMVSRHCKLADYCLNFVNGGMFERVRKATHLLHYAPNVPISKFELLEAINVVYNRKLKIRRVESPTSRMRILDSKFCSFC